MNNLDKQYNELIDEVYKKYSKQVIANNLHLIPAIDLPQTKEEFINKIKTDDEFAKRWEVQVNRRELKKLERINIAIEKKLTHKTAHLTKDFDYQKWCDENNIPTQLISLTYNNETIETYE